MRPVTARRVWLMAGVLCAGGLFATSAAAQGEARQQEEDPAKTTRVTLGSASAAAGSPAVVPVYLTPAEGARIGRLSLQVQFVSRSLKLSKIEPGVVVEMSGTELASRVEESRNEQGLETTTVTLEATAPPDVPEGIRGGLLAYLNFHLSEEARPASVTVKVTGEARAIGSDQPLANLRTFDAQVDVLAPGTEPIVACFFFTH